MFLVVVVQRVALIAKTHEEAERESGNRARSGNTRERLEHIKDVVKRINLRVCRQSVGFCRVLEQGNHVQAGELILAIDGGLGIGLEGVILQKLEALMCLCQYLVPGAIGKGTRRAGMHAGRYGKAQLYAIVDGRGFTVVQAAHAGVALVDLILGTVEARYVKGAGRGAVLTANALCFVYRHKARALINKERARRAHLDAGRINAVHTAAASNGPVDSPLLVVVILLIENSIFIIYSSRCLIRMGKGIGVEAERRGQVVPALAGNLTALAARAF